MNERNTKHQTHPRPPAVGKTAKPVKPVCLLLRGSRCCDRTKARWPIYYSRESPLTRPKRRAPSTIHRALRRMAGLVFLLGFWVLASPSLLLHANQGATDNPDETRDCAPPTDDRTTRDPAELSRGAARTAPSPSFHFILVGRNAAKATSKSGVEVEGGPRVQIRAPRPCLRPRGPPGASIEAGEAEI